MKRINYASVVMFYFILLLMSCGQEEKVINHFAECAATLETCEAGCEPTQEQEDALEACYNICFFNWEDNGFSSQVECIEFCYNQTFGPNTPEKCRKECKESFYECGFGPDWRDLNIEKPQ